MRYLYGWLMLCGLVFSSVCAPAWAHASDVILSLDVAGNRYVENEAIVAMLDTKVGDVLNRRTMSHDIQRLYASGNYEDLSFSGVRTSMGIKLTLQVKEHPFIQSYAVNGNDAVSSKDLKRRLVLKEGMIFSPGLLQKDINTLRRGYLKKGFYQVQITPEKTILDDGAMKLVLQVTEGKKTHVRQIRFVGNHDFADDALKREVSASTTDLFAWVLSKDIIDTQKFSNDGQRLSQFYQNRGYLDMRVESSQILLTPDKSSFYLSFSLYEGPIYTVSQVDVTGDLEPSKEKLVAAVKLKEGGVYSLNDLRETIQEMTVLVGDEGYAFATVTPLFKRNIEEHTVAITFDVEKGRKVYVERIEVVGNEKTDDMVIRREMRLDESEKYSATGMKLSKEKLARLQLFKDVSISMPRGSADDRVNAKVDVEENKTGSFTFGIGYSQIEKMLFRIKTSEKNLLGQGYGLNATADVGSRTQNFDVSLTDPYFLDRDMQATISVNKTQTKLNQIATATYTQNNVGGGLGLSFALSEHVSDAIRYSYSKTDITNLPANATLILLSQAGRQSTSEVSDILAYDSRDRAVNTTAGANHSITVGAATIGGSNRFTETSMSTQNFFAVSEDLVLRGSTAASWIQGYAGKTVPIYRRYSLGGDNILHGFDFYGISMRDPATGEAVGGNKKISANLDLFFPLPYVKTDGFRGVLFMDSGTVWGNAIGNVPTLKFSPAQIRMSAGLGMEWMSPVGPITFSWAKVLKKQPQDLLRSFDFALGSSF